MSTTRILIRVGDDTFDAELNDSETARAILEALPITAHADTWGKEIYFSIPVQASPSPDARDVLPAGSLAYWPPGSAFCIIWGRTPASRGDECRFASAVNPLGRITSDLAALDSIRSGAPISITLA